MPLHDYRCKSCETTEVRFVKLEFLAIGQWCGCGQEMEIVYLTPPMMAVDILAYQSPVDGKVINSRRQRKEDLKRNGCVEWEPGANEESQKRRAKEEAQTEAAVDSTVEEFITNLPVRKKELLDQELRSGADVSVTRL